MALKKTLSLRLKMNLKSFLRKHFIEDTKEIDGLSFKVWRNFEEVSEDQSVIVFNYGLLCTFEHYKYQIKFFQEHGNQPMILMDYRGHHPDNTAVDFKDITFVNMAKDNIKLFELYNLKKVDLICHSMGVNVGLETALMVPQTVRSLVLISGSVFPPQNVMFNSNIINFLQPYIEGIYEQFPTAFDFVWKKQVKLDLVKKFVHVTGFNHKKVGEDFIEIYLETLTNYPPKLFFHLLNSMKDHDILGRIHNIKAPVLIISGDKDNIIPLHLQNILQENLPNAKIYIVNEGNHVPQIDDPDLVNERLELFLSQL